MDIDYNILFHEDSQIAEIYIEDEEEFESVREYVAENVFFLNEMFEGTDISTHFKVRGEIQHYFLIENCKKDNRKGKESHKKEETRQPEPKYERPKKEEKKKMEEPQPKSVRPKIAEK